MDTDRVPNEGDGGQPNTDSHPEFTDRPMPTEPDGKDLIQVDNPLGIPGPDEIQR